MKLIDKLVKNSTIKATSVLSESKFFSPKDYVQTDVPMINVALSGKLDGGLASGLYTIAGPSKHFKSAFSLLIASAFQRKYKDAVVLFYDSEFGTPLSYFEKLNIDMERAVHTPITDIEQLKHDISTQLNDITEDDKIIIIVDSIGNLASKKETDDALDGKSVADMSRAKQLKSLFRIVTPHLTIKNIPMIVVNHTYKEISMFPKDIVSGGTGSYYSSGTIWIVGRQQEKESNDLVGYNFIINIEKSRLVKEKSKIPVSVTFDGGIQKYSGLFDLALEGNFIKEVSKGWYSINDDKKVRKSDIEGNSEFYESLLNDEEFKSYVESKYSL